MTWLHAIPEEELHAFIDGELSPQRAARVAAEITRDPELAALVAAFRADKAALAAAFAPIAAQPVPPGWHARIDGATARPRLLPAWGLALAACLILAIGMGAWLHGKGGQITAPPTDIVARADAARQGMIKPAVQLAGEKLADHDRDDKLLAGTVGMRVHVPDLARLGWQLAEIDTYADSAMIRYRATDGRDLTLYVRRSDGTPRFDLLSGGARRICVWQDDVIGAVMMGDMSAGQMMRVASAAYTALNL